MLSKILKLFRPPPPPGEDEAEPHPAGPPIAEPPAVAQYQAANRLKDQGLLEDALAAYERAVVLDPGYANAFCNRGFVLERLNRLDAACDSYQRALEINPTDALAWYNRAAVLGRLGRPQEALRGYERAIALRPGYAEAYCNRGILLMEQRQWDAALASFDRAIEIHPGFHQAHFSRAVLLHKQMRPEAALSGFDRAIELQPDYLEALRSRAVLHTESWRWDAAREALDRCLMLRPDDPETLFVRGNLWLALGVEDAALAEFDRAIAVKPDYADAHYNRADTLVRSRKFEAAVAAYDTVLSLEPEYSLALGMRRHAKMHLCDWSGLDADLERLRDGLEAGRAVSPPFPVLALLDSASLQFKAARLWVSEKIRPDPRLRPLPAHPPGGRIRVGYFSADFCEHPVSTLLAPIIEAHDRAAFEVVAFATGAASEDAMRRRLETAFERFVDVRGQPDADIVALARRMQIDIAVDLGGYTGSNRPTPFAMRASPVQVGYLGYPGTTAADTMDYLIADRTVVPPGRETAYVEKIARLPDSFLPGDGTRPIADTDFTREELGLPAAGFVYCCFNNSYKITSAVFDRWMRILTRTQDSVLWLSQHEATAARNLRLEASRRGVAPDRLVFAARMPSPAQHLARLRCADLFLDTSPYNAHATALDALWAGLPVLTVPGDAFAGRVAASLLNALALPELVCGTADEYEEVAVAFAADAARLAEVRRKLVSRRRESALFDGRRYARNLEAAYRVMYHRSVAGLTPISFDAEP